MMVHKTYKRPFQIVLIGDSDIERWPETLWPSANSVAAGYSGITLRELLPYVESQLRDSQEQYPLILVVCAGENDIGSGTPLSKSEHYFKEMLDLIFPISNKEICSERYLIFLGPKFEPWLQDDLNYRREYVLMSKAFDQCCKKHSYSIQIAYVDCLTMFCSPTTSNLKGALLGGRAKPDSRYFDPDQLHLCADGYKIWKKTVENHIQQIIANFTTIAI